MDMQTSGITCFKKFITIKGRASRSEYWWFILVGWILNFLVIHCLEVISSTLGWDEIFFLTIHYVVNNILYVVILIPTICASVRRLHDTNTKGWWLLLYPISIAVIFIGGIGIKADVSVVMHTISIIFIIIGIIGFIIGGIYLLALHCLKGTEGDNRFGKDPLAE